MKVPIFVGAALQVNQAAAPGGDGTSWATAYRYLSDALGFSNEIWVAEGIYYPDQSEANPTGTGLRTDTFVLYSGCKIYGGFSGGETSLDQRNYLSNRTILSGDLDNNDTDNFSNHGDNSYHVVYSGITTNLLDGLTITGGAATETAGNNSYGGGIFDTQAVVKNCIFTRNQANRGGGYYGAGAIVNCIFENNKANNEGGGAFYDGSEITNCVFYSNTAILGGGAFCYGNGVNIINCTFTDNLSTYGTNRGDALYISTYDSDGSNGSEIYNCIFWANRSSADSIYVFSGSLSSAILEFDYCAIEGGVASIESEGNVTVNYGSYNTTSNPNFAGNYRLSAGSPCLDASDNDRVPADIRDIDNDGNISESLPLDADGKIRFVDDPAADVIGETPPVIDMGACERVPVIFVDQDATGDNNGTSWRDAFNALQDALSIAVSDDEVWVAAGTYYPDQGTGYTPGDRNASFELSSGVGIYGGFQGNETLLEERNWDLHETTLTGSIGLVGISDDSYHVVWAIATSSSARLDGFKIAYGNANGTGGDGNGGGLYTNSSPTIANCRFTNNRAVYGGGIYHGNADYGGPVILNCQFINNLGSHDGGGIYTRYNDSTPLIVNCLFRDNTANVYGGGLYSYDCSPEIINCTFNNNTGTNYGGALDQVGTGTATIRNSIFWGNISDQGYEIATAGTSIVDIQYTDVEGGLTEPFIDIENSASVNWGSGNITTNPAFADTDLRLGEASPCIDAGDNSVIPVGITTDLDGSPRRQDNPAVADTGSGSAPIVDMGAYEWNNTPAGENIVVQVNGHTITFENVVTSGITSVTESSTGTTPPSGFQTCTPPQYFEVVTTAIYDGTIQVCLSYEESGCNESELYLLHYENEDWMSVEETSVNTVQNIICGEVTGLSEFLLATPDVVLPIIYVDQTATGVNSGTSWTDAFVELSNALAAAVSGDEIWVAQGIYLPDTSGLGDARNATFQLINGVEVYGGFPSGGDVFANRSPETNVTVLSGDLNGDDGPDFANYGENCRHVVTGSGTDATAVLDGFVMTSGNASDIAYPAHSGGGMYNYFGSPTVNQCAFEYNLAEGRGGGVFSQESTASFSGCTFTGNKAGTGGAMNNAYNANTLITDCVFEENQASEFGGAIQNTAASQSDLYNCIFRNNTATDKGGAFRSFNSWPIFINCVFEDNSAQNSGGAIWSNGGSASNAWGCLFVRNRAGTGGAFANDEYGNIQMANCTFADNIATNKGGAVSVDIQSAHTLRNCILWNNTAPAGPQMAFADSSTGYITYSDVEGGSTDIPLETGSTLAAYTNNIDSDPQFVVAGFNFRLLGGSACVDAGNNADVSGSLTTDLDGRTRKIDDPTVTDSGSGTPPIVDMGCYERASPLYVDDTATGSNNGTSWGNAFNDLQDAFDTATPEKEIWVADGSYQPDQGNSYSAGDRSATYQLMSKVAVYGGFPNGGGNWSTRNPQTNVTILDGDIGTDDDNSDNSYHILTGSGTDASAILDGFTIEKGYYVAGSGAGIVNIEGSPTISRCRFSQNLASNGAAIYNIRSNPIITDCEFYQNTTAPTSNAGGGMYNNGSSPVILHCEFVENWARWGGGAIYNHAGSHALIQNCLFVRNGSSGYGGGAIHNSSTSTTENHTYPIITCCTFYQNTATENGGGIYNRRGSAPIMTNCILWNNSDGGPQDYSAQIFDNSGSNTVLNYCDVQGWTASMSGLGNINQDPLFFNTAGDDYHLKSNGWRWDPSITGWGYDSETSRCIDAGSPGYSITGEEPLVAQIPGYGENIRINMGTYGGTKEASMPPYNWTVLSDVNNDGACNLIDYAELSREWISGGDELPCDFDRDDTVELGDLTLMLQDFLNETTWH